MSALTARRDLESLSAGNTCLSACFERVAKQHPDRIALGSGTWQPSYNELNVAANRLAHAFLRQGIAVGHRIGILARHDTPLVAAILGALKAGAIVVVFSPREPAVRLKQVLEDAQPRLIVTDAAHRELAAEFADQDCAILTIEDIAGQGLDSDPGVYVAADSTAFLTYTSGTTGRPNGVMQTHRLHVHNVLRNTRALDLTADDRITLFASLNGSQGVHTLLFTLLNGAALCPFSTIEKGVTGLADWITDRRITVYVSSASLFRSFMRTLDGGARFPLVRALRIASEMATSQDFRTYQQHFPDSCKFVHTISSTETGIMAYLRLSHGDSVADGRLPVGRAAEGVEIVLHDDDGAPVRHGNIGEIVVRSRNVAAGYWRNSELTAARFLQEANGIYAFRTGDLGRINHSGSLEVVGRKDARVKVRGYSIDIGDVEEAILALAEVRAAAVCVINRPDGGKQLVAYVVARKECTVTVTTLRRALHASLPTYMIPSTFVFLDNLPLTTNGKIDRVQLQKIQPQPPEHEPVGNWSESEASLAEIWAEAFERAGIGRHDDFYEMGGDSLIAAVIAARVHAVFGIETNLGIFANYPTLAEFAGVIDRMRGTSTSAKVPQIVPMRRNRHPPLSLFQERIWRYSRMMNTSAAYTVASRERIRGPLDRQWLHECLSAIVDRHEILRTTFENVFMVPRQIIHAARAVEMPFIDLSGAADAHEQASRIFKREAARIFDLRKLPLFHFMLVRVGENEHWLLDIFHHIISDGWSRRMLLLELTRLYEAKARREAPSLLPPRLQYADYAAWQRKSLHPGAPSYDETISWWQDAFANAPVPLPLPFQRSAPIGGIDPADGIIEWRLGRETSQRLDVLRRPAGCTAYVAWLAAFSALLAAETGQRDIVIGTYISKRRGLDTENMLGFFSNLVTLRFHCDLDATFRQWLVLVRNRVSETWAHSEIPFEDFRRELLHRGTVIPDIQIIVNLSHPQLRIRFANLELTGIDRRNESMPWGFSVNLEEGDYGQQCRTTFDAGIYDPSSVRDFTERFRGLLDTASQHPDVPLRDVLTAASQEEIKLQY